MSLHWLGVAASRGWDEAICVARSELGNQDLTIGELHEYTERMFATHSVQDVDRIAADFGPSAMSGLITADSVQIATQQWGWLQRASLRQWDEATSHFCEVASSATDVAGLETLIRAIQPGASESLEELAGQLYIEALFGNMTYEILRVAQNAAASQLNVASGAGAKSGPRSRKSTERPAQIRARIAKEQGKSYAKIRGPVAEVAGTGQETGVTGLAAERVNTGGNKSSSRRRAERNAVASVTAKAGARLISQFSHPTDLSNDGAENAITKPSGQRSDRDQPVLTPSHQVASEDSPQADEPTNCTICLESIEAAEAYVTDCRHSFHLLCIKEWKSRGSSDCPLCRQAMDPIRDTPEPSWGWSESATELLKDLAIAARTLRGNIAPDAQMSATWGKFINELPAQAASTVAAYPAWQDFTRTLIRNARDSDLISSHLVQMVMLSRVIVDMVPIPRQVSPRWGWSRESVSTFHHLVEKAEEVRVNSRGRAPEENWMHFMNLLNPDLRDLLISYSNGATFGEVLSQHPDKGGELYQHLVTMMTFE
ncbi:RING finger domain-containing protein [Streptomyces sp. NPDC048270]|uniref:RING finger domain-containing protein n=1 Tax=Streptomyces sp. NPDC048270 TaxID=3154615 RepID=UPI0033D5594E